MNVFGVWLNGRKIESSLSWANIHCAWLSVGRLPRMSVYKPRRAAPFIRTSSEVRISAIDEREPIYPNLEASERVHRRHIRQCRNLVILSSTYPYFLLNRVKIEDDPKISMRWRNLGRIGAGL